MQCVLLRNRGAHTHEPTGKSDWSRIKKAINVMRCWRRHSYGSVTWCKVWSGLDFCSLQPSGHYMFNIQQFYVLPTQCIYVFCVDLRTNSHRLPVQRSESIFVPNAPPYPKEHCFLERYQKWVPRVFPGGKGGRCVRLTTLPPSCAVVMKSGNFNFLEPSGPSQACNGTDLPSP
jgi:hypothetical protein